MRNTRALALALLGLLGPALAQEKPKPASPQPVDLGPSFPSQVEQVTVDVVVTDKKGVPITTLNQSDFKVFDEGKPQELTSFERVVLPERPAEAPPSCRR
jgi:hypothetical protein